MVIAKLPKKMQSELATQSTSIGVTQKAQALGKKKSPRKRKIVSKKKK
jgi:hypothetical protein